jgi:capsular polysaccharide biosynthesis protein
MTSPTAMLALVLGIIAGMSGAAVYVLIFH